LQVQGRTGSTIAFRIALRNLEQGINPMGKFFLVIIGISIALVLGTAVLVTYF
jgi:hypothetical protein